jgi:hypothetical protein
MFDNQTTNYLLTLNSRNTHKSYSRALLSFHDWYVTTYAEEPCAELLTDFEVREWLSYLSNIRKLSAATVTYICLPYAHWFATMVGCFR